MNMSTAKEKYCIGCGATLVAAAEMCPNCGVSQNTRMVGYSSEKHCTSCGAALVAAAEMCTNCGVRQVGKRSRVTFIILAIFFGGFGVHNFYAGYTTKGGIQLAIWMFSWPLMIIAIGAITIWIPWVWAIVEAIIITQDAEGNKFR